MHGERRNWSGIIAQNSQTSQTAIDTELNGKQVKCSCEYEDHKVCTGLRS